MNAGDPFRDSIKLFSAAFDPATAVGPGSRPLRIQGKPAKNAEIREVVPSGFPCCKVDQTSVAKLVN
jgi:hypothetical protein